MLSFEQVLSPDSWTEILQGGSSIAFDQVAEARVELYFTHSDTAPADSAIGSKVYSWHEDWDFTFSLGEAGIQRIWARGDNTIRGIRG